MDIDISKRKNGYWFLYLWKKFVRIICANWIEQ